MKLDKNPKPNVSLALNELKRTDRFEIDHPLVLAVAAHLQITDTNQFFRDAQAYKYA